jgi:hypothetical protein
LLTADGNPLVPEETVKLRIYVDGRLVWVKAAVSGMNGFDLLLWNDALAQLGNFLVQYDEAGVGSFSTKSVDEEGQHFKSRKSQHPSVLHGVQYVA